MGFCTTGIKKVLFEGLKLGRLLTKTKYTCRNNLIVISCRVARLFYLHFNTALDSTIFPLLPCLASLSSHVLSPTFCSHFLRWRRGTRSCPLSSTDAPPRPFSYWPWDAFIQKATTRAPILDMICSFRYLMTFSQLRRLYTFKFHGACEWRFWRGVKRWAAMAVLYYCHIC